MAWSQTKAQAFAQKLAEFQKSLDPEEQELFGAIMGCAKQAVSEVQGYDAGDLSDRLNTVFTQPFAATLPNVNFQVRDATKIDQPGSPNRY